MLSCVIFYSCNATYNSLYVNIVSSNQHVPSKPLTISKSLSLKPLFLLGGQCFVKMFKLYILCLYHLFALDMTFCLLVVYLCLHVVYVWTLNQSLFGASINFHMFYLPACY